MILAATAFSRLAFFENRGEEAIRVMIWRPCSKMSDIVKECRWVTSRCKMRCERLRRHASLHPSNRGRDSQGLRNHLFVLLPLERASARREAARSAPRSRVESAPADSSTPDSRHRRADRRARHACAGGTSRASAPACGKARNENTMANITLSAMGTNRKRATPLRKNIGMNTMQMQSNETNAGMTICEAPSMIAASTSLPCSRW